MRNLTASITRPERHRIARTLFGAFLAFTVLGGMVGHDLVKPPTTTLHKSPRPS